MGAARPPRGARGGGGAAWAGVRRVAAGSCGRGPAGQEELAGQPLEPAGGQRLGTGIHRTAHKDTALLLARTLSVAVPVQALFVAAARSHGPAGALAAWRTA